MGICSLANKPDKSAERREQVTILLWVLAYLSGACMFSFWIGKWLNRDIRKIGDGNPGAANLWKTAGYRFGLIGIFMDFLKGYLPVVAIIKYYNPADLSFVLICLAPILGHAYSPFLHFKGGKALAVSFGVWAGLSQFFLAFVYAVILAILKLFMVLKKRSFSATTEEDGFFTCFGMFIFVIYLYTQQYPQELIWLGIGNLLIVTWKNRRELRKYHKKIMASSPKWVKKRFL